MAACRPEPKRPAGAYPTSASEKASELGSGQKMFAWNQSSGWCSSAWPSHATCQACGSGSPRSRGTSLPTCSGSGQCIRSASSTATAAAIASSRRVSGGEGSSIVLEMGAARLFRPRPRPEETRMAENEDGANVHTTPEEGHPAGESDRSARDVGGPTSGEETGDETGGAPGTKETGMDSHE